MKSICLFISYITLVAATTIFILRADTSLDSSTPDLNNPNPRGCGVSLSLPDTLIQGGPLQQLVVTGTAGDTPATLTLRVTSGGDRIDNQLWLDPAGTMPANDPTWPVAANSSRTETLFIRGVQASIALGDVRMIAAMSCGLTANDSTTVGRPCSLIAKPTFPGPSKWFYAAKVEKLKSGAFGGILYRVTWLPPDAIGLYDTGGFIQPNVREFSGSVTPGPVRTLHLGPRLGRLWITKKFTAHYTDPCGGPGIHYSESTSGWALLGLEGPIVNGGRDGGGDDPNAGGGPLNPPPPPPDAHGQGGNGGGPDPEAPNWPDLVGNCDDNPWPDDREPFDLPPAEGVEIIAETIQKGITITGFQNGNVANDQSPVYLTMTGTAKLQGSIRGVVSQASGVWKQCIGGGITTESYAGDPNLNPDGWIDQVDTLGWNITTNEETSHGGYISWTAWNADVQSLETMTWSFHWDLADPFTQEMARESAIATAWNFRDIYLKGNGYNYDSAQVHGYYAALHYDQKRASYRKLRYKIRISENWDGPTRVSWVERFSPAGQVHFDGQVRDGEEYVVKTALIPAGESETEHYEIDPATMQDKQGEWDVYLLRVEDMSVAYDPVAGEFLPVAGGIPDSGRMPDLALAIAEPERTGNQYRIDATVEFEDSFGDIPGGTPTDAIEFLIDGLVVGQITGLSADAGGNTDTPWSAKTSRRTLQYQYTVPPKQGFTSLSVRTVPPPDGAMAIASTGVLLDIRPEGSQVPPELEPEFVIDGTFDTNAPDQLAITLAGGTPATLLETGPATNVFTGTATLNDAPAFVSLAVNNSDPALDRYLSASLSLGTPPEAYQIIAAAVPGSPVFPTSSIRRIVPSPPSELPVIHLSSPPNPQVVDSMTVSFSGGTQAELLETAADSMVFSGEAPMNGTMSPATIVLGGIHGWASGSPAILAAHVHLGGGLSHYIESMETTPASGQFEAYASEPIETSSSTAVSIHPAGPEDRPGTGSARFHLRLKVPAFAAKQLEEDELSLWVNNTRIAAATNSWLLPGEEVDTSWPFVNAVSAEGHPTICSLSRTEAGSIVIPLNIIRAPEFTVSLRRGDSTVWEHSHLIAGGVPEELPDDLSIEEHPYSQQVAGWYLLSFGPYGQALLQAFESVGGTIHYSRLPGNPFDSSLWWRGTRAWDRGKRAEIWIDNVQLKPLEAAQHLYRQLTRLFMPSWQNALGYENARPAPWPPEGLGLDDAERDEWFRQWSGVMTEGLASTASDLRMAMEVGVSIAFTPLGVVLGLSDAADTYRQGHKALALGIASCEAIPIFGKACKFAGKAAIMNFGRGAVSIADPALIPPITDALGRAIKSGRARPQAMRELREMLAEGIVPRKLLEDAYDMGHLQFKGSDSSKYRILEAEITTRRQMSKGLDDVTHHELPLKFERQFMIRGIDPNDGDFGWFVNTDYHKSVLHGGAGKDVLNKRGGAWNYQWEKFFDEFPNASADNIRMFRDKLWLRVKEKAPDPSVAPPSNFKIADIRWPYPIPGQIRKLASRSPLPVGRGDFRPLLPSETGIGIPEP